MLALLAKLRQIEHQRSEHRRHQHRRGHNGSEDHLIGYFVQRIERLRCIVENRIVLPQKLIDQRVYLLVDIRGNIRIRDLRIARHGKELVFEQDELFVFPLHRFDIIVSKEGFIGNELQLVSDAAIDGFIRAFHPGDGLIGSHVFHALRNGLQLHERGLNLPRSYGDRVGVLFDQDDLLSDLPHVE